MANKSTRVPLAAGVVLAHMLDEETWAGRLVCCTRLFRKRLEIVTFQF